MAQIAWRIDRMNSLISLDQGLRPAFVLWLVLLSVYLQPASELFCHGQHVRWYSRIIGAWAALFHVLLEGLEVPLDACVLHLGLHEVLLLDSLLGRAYSRRLTIAVGTGKSSVKFRR